mgnify:CR=1 FL=1
MSFLTSLQPSTTVFSLRFLHWFILHYLLRLLISPTPQKNSNSNIQAVPLSNWASVSVQHYCYHQQQQSAPRLFICPYLRLIYYACKHSRHCSGGGGSGGTTVDIVHFCGSLFSFAFLSLSLSFCSLCYVHTYTHMHIYRDCNHLSP